MSQKCCLPCKILLELQGYAAFYSIMDSATRRAVNGINGVHSAPTTGLSAKGSRSQRYVPPPEEKITRADFGAKRAPTQPTGRMTERYIYDTTGIADRLSGFQGPPAAVGEREAAMRREANRLARIVSQRH